MLTRVTSVFDRTVLVLAAPGYIELNEAALACGAIVFLGLAGQEAGGALADVLTAVKANGKSITLTALNSFQIRINWDKVRQYDPILAWQDDGVTMRVRDKGPLWFILPLDQHPELKRSEFTDMMIWQLSAIDIQQ